MSRYASWSANAVLFVLSCYLLASIVNTVFAALLSEPAPVVALAEAPALPSGKQWSDREVILTRNLFNASLLAPAAPPVVEAPLDEDLEATRLPLSLLGTVAAATPALSFAAVQDLEERKTLVLQVDDPVKRGATVLRIERRRIVLLENGSPRELALDEDEGKQASARGRSTARGRRVSARGRGGTSGRAAKLRELSRNRYQVKAEDVQEAVRNPATLFQQANFAPKLDDDGEMLGMEVSSIKPGSIFEEMGIEDGEIITQVNGLEIASQEDAGRLLAEFTQSSEFTVIVDGEDGPRTLTFSYPEE